MTAMVEIVIEISLDPDSGESHGMASDAEVLVNDCFYIRAAVADDALASAEEALIEARDKIRARSGVSL